MRSNFNIRFYTGCTTGYWDVYTSSPVNDGVTLSPPHAGVSGFASW